MTMVLQISLAGIYGKCMLISAVESQKGAITIQRYSVENQKGAIAVQLLWR